MKQNITQLKIKQIVFIVLLLVSIVPGICKAQLAFLGNGYDVYGCSPDNYVNNISVIDLNSKTILNNLSLPYPIADFTMVMSEDGSKAYLASNWSGDISVLDIATMQITDSIYVGFWYNMLCVSNDGNVLYAAKENYDTIKVINTQTNTVSSTIALGNGAVIKGMTLNPSGTKLYASCYTNTGDKIKVISTSNFSVLNNIPATCVASKLLFNPAGTKLFTVGTDCYNEVHVYNAVTETLETVMGDQLISPLDHLAISADGTILVATGPCFYSNMQIYNTNSMIRTADIDLTFNGLTAEIGALDILPDGSKVYFSCYDYPTYRFFSLSTANYSIDSIAPAPGISCYFSTNKFIFKKPEIEVQGGSPKSNINDGSFTTADSNHTSFGNVNTNSFLSRTYYIKNTGGTPLTISNVFLSGVHADEFSIGAFPAVIQKGVTDSFTVNFYPSSPGLKNAIVTIANNDADEASYDFAIQGTGTLPNIIYQTHSSANTVGVYDANNYTHLQDINVGAYPNGLSLNAAKSKLYVTNSNDNTVSVINTFTNTVIATITVGNYPVGICVNPSGNFVYVANKNSNTVTVINTITNSVITSVNVGNQPFGICVSSDGSKVYVTNHSSNTMSVINTSTNAVIATINVGIAPKGITLNPSGSLVYVANSGSNSVTAINTNNNTIFATTVVGLSPYSICFNATGTKYYVSNYVDFTIRSVPIAGGFPQTISVGNYPAGMSLSEDGSKLYVTGYGSDNVKVINTSNNAVIGTFANGSGPISFGNFAGSIPVPQIEIKGGGLLLPTTIENYDYTPSTSDNTDFGQVNSGNSVTHTFYIQNLGNTELTINGIDKYGPDTSMFSFGNIPTIVAPNATDSFTVTFTPTAAGIKTAYIHIASNVPNSSNFYYGVQGEGTGSFNVTLNLKLFLEGYYAGAGLMQPVLFNTGASLINTDCDYITVELHDALLYNTVFTSVVLLNTSGLATVNYPTSILGASYYIAIRARNSIETWSKLPVTFNSSPVYFDFSSQ